MIPMIHYQSIIRSESFSSSMDALEMERKAARSRKKRTSLIGSVGKTLERVFLLGRSAWFIFSRSAESRGWDER